MIVQIWAKMLSLRQRKWKKKLCFVLLVVWAVVFSGLVCCHPSLTWLSSGMVFLVCVLTCVSVMGVMEQGIED